MFPSTSVVQRAFISVKFTLAKIYRRFWENKNNFMTEAGTGFSSTQNKEAKYNFSCTFYTYSCLVFPERLRLFSN